MGESNMELQENRLNTYTLDRIEKIIREIVDKSDDAEYIYRGEAEYHEKVCSGLYRDYVKVKPKKCKCEDAEEIAETEDVEEIPETKDEEENHDVVGSQKVILEKIKKYIPEIGKNDSEILAQLQHYGARTNLIDFTPDFLIALFFACEKANGKNGRVLLIQRPKDVKEDKEEKEIKGYTVIEPPTVIDRIKLQKSLFVESTTGFIEPDKTVDIPRDLKVPILTYIEKHHAISREYVYNDIHGFIKSEDIETHWLEYHKGWSKKEKEMKKELENQDFSKAIDCYKAALKVESEFPEAYSELGQIYSQKSEYNISIENYNKAIELNPDDDKHYFSMAQVHATCDKYEEANEYYTKAIEKNDCVPYYHYERCKSRLKLAKWSDALDDMNIFGRKFEASERSIYLKLIAEFVDEEKIENVRNDIKVMLQHAQQED